MTFTRQGISLDREEHETVRRICTALQSKNMMNMYGTYTAEDDLASIFVFARDRAYICSAQIIPISGTATAVHWAFSNLLTCLLIQVAPRSILKAEQP